MRTIASTLLLLLISASSFAQDAAPVNNFWRDPLGDPMFPFYVVTVFVFLTAFMVVLVAIYMLQILNVFISKAAEERAERMGVTLKQEQSWWSKFWMSINALKPVAEEKDILLDHNYDGIKELDNHLPPWWKWLLYGSIVWAAIYMFVYHVSGTFPLMAEEYQVEVMDAEAQKAKLLATNPPLAIDESTLVYEKDEAIIQSGKRVYVTNCASCHLAEGQGSIGPNLTDEYWLHGGSVKDVYNVIRDGVQEKGMIPWGPVLSPEQIRDVTFYIMSIRGTNPPNPKAPQGVLYVEPASETEAQAPAEEVPAEQAE
jgi:cytochrome c oxidase cbb3-type subunit III